MSKWQGNPHTKTQMTRRLKWHEDPSEKKTEMTKRPEWQEDTNDNKTQVTRTPKWQNKPNWQKFPNYKKTHVEKDQNYRKIEVTRKQMWQQEWVAERLTDIMVTDGHMSILQKILKLYSLSNLEGNNTSTTISSIPQ